MQGGILHRSHSTPFYSFLQNHPRPSTFYLRFPSISYSLPALCAKYPRGTLDSGADRVRSWNFGRNQDGERRWKAKKSRRWWFDDGASEAEELAPGFWEEFIDNLWFLKVLGSYGWLSPFIMISWLAASGPKAFLMAFSIPLGLNVLTFGFKKLSGYIQSNTNYKPSNTPKMENVDVIIEEEEEQEMQWKKSEQRTQDQSDSGKFRENGSVNSNGAPSFGGWEDLIDERELKARQAKKPRKQTKKTSMPLEERMRELKMRVEEERDLPLLLKLLVVVFPFLSTWTELM